MKKIIKLKRVFIYFVAGTLTTASIFSPLATYKLKENSVINGNSNNKIIFNSSSLSKNDIPFVKNYNQNTMLKNEVVSNNVNSNLKNNEVNTITTNEILSQKSNKVSKNSDNKKYDPNKDISFIVGGIITGIVLIMLMLVLRWLYKNKRNK